MLVAASLVSWSATTIGCISVAASASSATLLADAIWRRT